MAVEFPAQLVDVAGVSSRQPQPRGRRGALDGLGLAAGGGTPPWPAPQQPVGCPSRPAETAATARDRLTAWIRYRGGEPGPLWTGQRGRLTTSGITHVVLAVSADAGQPGLRPHRLRHTYATRLRQGGADSAQVQALLGHASLDTTARYFRDRRAGRSG
ncbi:tyrosine-type recombinase/integrase [Micromonospora tulbaghiae]|uniref:tyrosine-type recombinase/integrase n=1 Tax=Micromonospora tulbaghiae TaxID=479978 RepID=UPI003EB71631